MFLLGAALGLCPERDRSLLLFPPALLFSDAPLGLLCFDRGCALLVRAAALCLFDLGRSFALLHCASALLLFGAALRFEGYRPFFVLPLALLFGGAALGLLRLERRRPLVVFGLLLTLGPALRAGHGAALSLLAQALGVADAALRFERDQELPLLARACILAGAVCAEQERPQRTGQQRPPENEQSGMRHRSAHRGVSRRVEH